MNTSMRPRAGRAKLIAMLVMAICFLLAFLYGMVIVPRSVSVRHEWIVDEQLGKELGERTVVFLSDLHIDILGDREKKILALIDQLKPDVLLLGGDFVKWNGDYEPALSFLSKIRDVKFALAVMGDHDYSSPRESCLFCHEPGTGKSSSHHYVRFLRNSWEHCVFENGAVWVGGVDLEREKPSIENRQLPLWAGMTTAIVVSHNPLAFDFFNDDESVVVLAGDTHGGQIPLPAWLWRLLGYEKNAKYERGWFHKGRKKMYVSNGIGTSHIPVRLFRQPEITVFHFEK
jgi:predicted MPP superfamily phosphohydrolase